MKKILLLIATVVCAYSIAQNNEKYDGKVGINTTDPKATLDVEGHMKIEPQFMDEYAYPNPRPEELSALFRNKKTGIFFTGPNRGAKMVFKLKYKIYTDQAVRDESRDEDARKFTTRVYRFNTKIPYNRYHLIQTHSVFKIENPDGTIEIPAIPPIANDPGSNRNFHYFPLKRVQLTEYLAPDGKSPNTWAIFADYPHVVLPLKKEGQKAFWDITILAIDKRYVTDTAESYKQK